MRPHCHAIYTATYIRVTLFTTPPPLLWHHYSWALSPRELPTGCTTWAPALLLTLRSRAIIHSRGSLVHYTTLFWGVPNWTTLYYFSPIRCVNSYFAFEFSTWVLNWVLEFEFLSSYDFEFLSSLSSWVLQKKVELIEFCLHRRLCLGRDATAFFC